jgi:hypothetical protein
MPKWKSLSMHKNHKVIPGTQVNSPVNSPTKNLMYLLDISLVMPDGVFFVTGKSKRLHLTTEVFDDRFL